MKPGFTNEPEINGVKGLVYIGSNLLMYKRDNNTKLFPLYYDIPGGGTDPSETPFETFAREVKEEFGLDVKKENIVYTKRFPSLLKKGKFGYFMVARLPESAKSSIKFGDEGLHYFLMTEEEFLASKKVWPQGQELGAEFIRSK